MIPVLCFAAGFAMVCNAPYARAHDSPWVQFELCKHKTGQQVESMVYGGVQVEGVLWINPDKIKINAVVQVHGQNCSLLMDDRSQVSVIGSPEHITCELAHRHDCDEN